MMHLVLVIAIVIILAASCLLTFALCRACPCCAHVCKTPAEGVPHERERGRLGAQVRARGRQA